MDINVLTRPFISHTEMVNTLMIEALKDPQYKDKAVRAIRNRLDFEIRYMPKVEVNIDYPTKGDCGSAYGIPINLSDFEDNNKNGVEKIVDRMMQMHYYSMEQQKVRNQFQGK